MAQMLLFSRDRLFWISAIRREIIFRSNYIPPLDVVICTLGISLAPAFVDDFPSYAHKFNQRTFHVRLINLCTSDKKSSHKIRHKETPRVHVDVLARISVCVISSGMDPKSDR